MHYLLPPLPHLSHHLMTLSSHHGGWHWRVLAGVMMAGADNNQQKAAAGAAKTAHVAVAGAEVALAAAAVAAAAAEAEARHW